MIHIAFPVSFAFSIYLPCTQSRVLVSDAPLVAALDDDNKDTGGPVINERVALAIQEIRDEIDKPGGIGAGGVITIGEIKDQLHVARGINKL